jgi:hypothetical protein
MAARAHIPFTTAFEDAVRPTGNLAAMATDATLKAQLLAQFNRTYKIAYELPFQSNVFWEDALTWAEITPSSGLISWDVLGDARNLEIYTADPRETRMAASVQFFTDKTGILVSEDLPTVWVSWTPRVYPFNTTAWVHPTTYAVGDVRTVSSLECYRCISAHSSNANFSTDLAASRWVLLPVLEVLHEFCIRHLHASWLREAAGQVKTGVELQNAALTELLETHRAELRRNRESPKP